MTSTIFQIKQMVEEKGFAYVAESVLPAKWLFALALDEGYGFSMEPYSKRRCGYEHPHVTKHAASLINSGLVQEIRELKAQIAEMEKRFASVGGRGQS